MRPRADLRGFSVLLATLIAWQGKNRSGGILARYRVNGPRAACPGALTPCFHRIVKNLLNLLVRLTPANPKTGFFDEEPYEPNKTDKTDKTYLCRPAH